MVNSQLSHEIISVFNTVFSASEGTVLSGGAAEPFYEPGDPATIFFEKILSEVRCMRWRIGVSRVGFDVSYLTMGTGIVRREGIVPDRRRFTKSRHAHRRLSCCFVRRSIFRLR